jgi:hypothetical protein
MDKCCCQLCSRNITDQSHYRIKGNKSEDKICVKSYLKSTSGFSEGVIPSINLNDWISTANHDVGNSNSHIDEKHISVNKAAMLLHVSQQYSPPSPSSH